MPTTNTITIQKQAIDKKKMQEKRRKVNNFFLGY